MVTSCVDHKSQGLRKGNAAQAGAHAFALLFPAFLAIGSRWSQRLDKDHRAKGMSAVSRRKFISGDPMLLLVEIGHSVWWKSTTLIGAAKKQAHKISEYRDNQLASEVLLSTVQIHSSLIVVAVGRTYLCSEANFQ